MRLCTLVSMATIICALPSPNADYSENEDQHLGGDYTENEEEFFKKAGAIYSNSECGRENTYRREMNNDYISGGEQAKPNRYPWMVHIVGIKEGGNTGACGGSLISDTVVLTALHCLDNKVAWQGVKVGADSIQDGADYQLIKPKMVLWPKVPYRHGNLLDLGVIILEKPVDLSNQNVGTICLPSKGKEDKLKGKTALALGWGRQYNDIRSTNLKEVELKIARPNRNLHPLVRKYQMFTKVKKIGGIPQDPCRGDSGGPLQYKQSGQWTIIGVLGGRGYDCKKDVYRGFGRWSKITPFLDWIHCVLENESKCDAWRRKF